MVAKADDRSPRDDMARLLEIAVVAAAYAGTGWLGLQFPYFGRNVTLIWPPVGIALAALMLRGPRVAPGVAIGALLVTAVTGTKGSFGLTIALGNTLGPLITSVMLTRVLDVRGQLDRFRDVGLYVLVGVLGTSVLTGTVGAAALGLHGLTPAADLPRAWLAWVAGDAAGVTIVGTLLLAWGSQPVRGFGQERSATELVGLVTALALLTTVVMGYGADFPSLGYVLFPVLLWASLRLGPRGASLAVVAITGAAAIGMAAGVGPYAGAASGTGMLSLWIFFSVMSVSGLLITALVAERDQAIMQKEQLMRELDHRVKNTLATVLAVADQSRSSTVDVQSYIATFGARIRALARTHEALARSEWEGVKLGEVVDTVLAPYTTSNGMRATSEGDDVLLSPRSSTPIAMALHELATNAAKYGAWSRGKGRVAVTWEDSGGDGLELVWRESGGPTVAVSPVAGFGLQVIEGLVGHELHGSAELDFQPTGLVCRLRIPRVT